jgi:hypothetical protein
MMGALSIFSSVACGEATRRKTRWVDQGVQNGIEKFGSAESRRRRRETQAKQSLGYSKSYHS